ncbi:insulin-like [Sphaerodactylus townsendi]|uniref:insulin-like n=1 Tax=Sphaerodactylus townsendi TaxID=933632 RepID=UPI002026FD99|nr:insulin-like [Sphaerodactylus townsendi]
MAFWNRLLPFLALLAALAPMANYAGTTKQLCGSDLVEALMFVCGDRGIYYKPKKRWKVKARKVDANAFLKYRLKKRGIVEQCCENACSHNVLESYCNK